MVGEWVFAWWKCVYVCAEWNAGKGKRWLGEGETAVRHDFEFESRRRKSPFLIESRAVPWEIALPRAARVAPASWVLPLRHHGPSREHLYEF